MYQRISGCVCTIVWEYAHLLLSFLLFWSSVNRFHQILETVYNIKSSPQCLTGAHFAGEETEAQREKIFYGTSAYRFIFGCWQSGSPANS